MTYTPLGMWAKPVGQDVMAMAYRLFDHWLKHEHNDCDHESQLDCIDEYARTHPDGYTPTSLYVVTNTHHSGPQHDASARI